MTDNNMVQTPPKRTNRDMQNTTQKTQDRIARTPTQPEDERRSSGTVSIPRSTCGSRCLINANRFGQTYSKFVCYNEIYLCWTHIASLTPPLLIEVFVPNQDSERSCICVLLGTWLDLFLQLFYWNLELDRHRGTFIFFSFFFCSFIIVKRIFVMNKTPNSFHIEVSIMISITIILKMYNISKQQCFPYTISIWKALCSMCCNIY